MTVFVGTQANAIKQHEGVEFHYVASEDNPADVCSRGTTAQNLIDCDHRRYGPKWLRDDYDQWPKTNIDGSKSVRDTVTDEIFEQIKHEAIRSPTSYIHPVGECHIINDLRK